MRTLGGNECYALRASISRYCTRVPNAIESYCQLHSQQTPSPLFLVRVTCDLTSADIAAEESHCTTRFTLR